MALQTHIKFCHENKRERISPLTQRNFYRNTGAGETVTMLTLPKRLDTSPSVPWLSPYVSILPQDSELNKWLSGK